MDTNQIYTIVNEVNAEAFGSTDIDVVDAQGLVSLGDAVLSSTTNTEAFLNTLVQRIGRTIISFRQYRNKLADMVVNDFEYGAILQKIRVHLTEAETDPAYALTDGQSVDPWTINKPDVEQKLFVTRTPYMFSVTIARKQLKEAFLSESAMGAFIGAVFGQVRNSIEVSLENLGRACIANMIGEFTPATPTGGTATTLNHEVALCTLYNTARGYEEGDAGYVNDTNALFDEAFMRFAVQTMKTYSDNMTDMSTLYNDGEIETFTPREDQRLKVLASFERALETVVQYSAFNEEMVRLNAFSTLNFWQSAQDPSYIKVERASDGAQVVKTHIVGVLFDRDALGMYKKDEDVLTTPVNAKGMYYNTFYHQLELWFNDTSENFVYFTLN
jgi:hypothetical protein